MFRGWFGIILIVSMLVSGCYTSTHNFKTAPLHKIKRATKQKQKFYTVTREDTMYSIAVRFGKEVGELALINNIKPPYIIYPGQRLKLNNIPAEELADNKYNRQNLVKASKHKAIETTRASTQEPEQTHSQQKQKIVQPLILANGPHATHGTAQGARWSWPAEGTVRSGVHTTSGIDIQNREDSPIKAAAHGRVVYSGNGLKGYGNLIIIKHGKEYLSAYAHNKKIFVKEGEEVKQGQQIATMGKNESIENDNNKATLHFEIRHNGNLVDPLKLLPKK